MPEIDVLIVGAGPAGLSAAIYTARAGMTTVIYEHGLPGGLVGLTAGIDNYPGFPEGISGIDLAARMHAQASRFGATLVNQEIARLWREEGRLFALAGKTGLEPRSAIVAAGSTPRKIGVPGEAEFTGKGVSYCATCDGPLYRGNTVAVVGGGDSALQEALFLARFAARVIVIHRRSELRAALVLQDEVRANPRITLALNRIVKAFEGGTQVQAVIVEDKATSKVESLTVEGVFVYVGYDPNVNMLGPEFRRSDSGFLVTDEKMGTSVQGVFAAGDVREKTLRQVSTAVGEGALAAMSAYAYVESLTKLA
jgi:thioredoxin reductase (NADPH)